MHRSKKMKRSLVMLSIGVSVALTGCSTPKADPTASAPAPSTAAAQTAQPTAAPLAPVELSVLFPDWASERYADRRRCPE